MFRKSFENLAKKINPWEEYNLKLGDLSWQDKLKVLFKKTYLWSQRAYLIRYLPVLKELNSSPGKYKTILEVGSGTLGLSRYTKRNIVGVDILTSGPHYQNLSLLRSDAAKLPFKDQAFDLVVSVDMLEHIPFNLRETVVSELFRVTKKSLFLGTPIFESSQGMEDKVRSIFTKKLMKWKGSEHSKESFKKRNIFLLEHEKFGLPKETEIKKYIDKSASETQKYYKVNILDNESLFVWYWGVLGDMKYSYLRWFVTTCFFIIFFFILSRIKLGGCYRKVFVVKKD